MNHHKHEKNKKENKHKMVYECLTNCVKWKLNVNLNYNKSSSGLVFPGQGIYFEKLESLILDNLYFIDTISKIEKSTFNNFEERALSQINQENNDLSNISFPLTNLLNHYNNEYFTEDYMNRVFFIEFDLENTKLPKESLRNLVEINNFFADNEISLNINGMLHGKQIFKNDVRFKIDAKKLIKSIQYRLEEHKSKFIEKQNNILKSNPNLEIKNSKLDFFTKINGNNSIGIEFYIPDFDNINIHNFQTNFYTITNSNISLSKIFIEFNLPLHVLFNNTGFNVNNGYQNFNNYNYGFGNNYNNFNNSSYPYNNKNGNMYKNNYNTQQNFYPRNNNFQNQQNPKKNSNDNCEPFSNSHEKSLNDVSSYSQNESESIKSKLKEISIYDEPKTNNNQVNINKNEEKLSANQNYKLNRTQEKNNFINLSNPENQNNYYNNNNNKKNKYSNGNDYYSNNGFKSTKNSYQRNAGSFNEKRQYDNNANNKFKVHNNNNTIDNNNRLNNSIISDNSKKFNYDNSSNLNNGFNLNLSKANSNPTFEYNTSFNHNQTSIAFSKGFEEKINQIGKTNIMTNSQLKNFGTNNALNGNQSKLTGLQILLTLYEGMCNFLIFAKACTPYVNKSVSHLLDDTSINDYFKSFEKISAYGLDVNFINEQNDNIIVNYSPTLSSMDITINDKTLCRDLIEEAEELLKNGLIEKNQLYKNDSENKVVYEYVVTECFNFTNFSNEKIKLEFNENKPPHSRLILSDQLEFIANKFPSIKKIEISKLDKNSWFSILWTPFKCTKPHFYNTSFLSYYQFNQSESDNYLRDFTNYCEIPIIGILPIKFDENIWLKKISKINSSMFSFNTDILDFRMTLNDSINNIHDFVYSKTAKTSIDYDFYLKCNI